jgi:hypothetical protein
MSIEEVQAKLQQAGQRAEHFRRLASNPSLSPEAALAAHNRMRSNHAAARLYQKALEYEIEKAEAAHSPPCYKASLPRATDSAE